MKYPVIYIKGRGGRTARFAELTGGKMRIVADIRSAAQALTALRADHAVVLYEQRDTETDSGNIRFLRSRFPGTGIILIASAPLEDAQRRSYLSAGVNSAVTGDITAEDFLRTVQFITDYSFSHKPATGKGGEMKKKYKYILAGVVAAVFVVAAAVGGGRNRQQADEQGAGHAAGQDFLSVHVKVSLRIVVNRIRPPGGKT